MSDLISRQAAIDALESIGSLDTEADKKYARSVFEALPSVQPETHDKHTETHACDLISRQAAIDALSQYPFEKVVNCVSIIEELPSAQPEQQWILCSERLPEKGGQYLVTRGHKSCGNLWNRVYIVNYSDLMGLKKEKIWWSGDVGKSDFEKYDDVLAWMPLPKPHNAETR